MKEEENKIKCPYCGVLMDKIDKSGVIIDKCPNDCGVWLDRGELDKIVMMKREHHPKEHKKYPPSTPGSRVPTEDYDWFYNPDYEREARQEEEGVED